MSNSTTSSLPEPGNADSALQHGHGLTVAQASDAAVHGDRDDRPADGPCGLPLPVAEWFSIEVFDGSSPARAWGEAYGDAVCRGGAHRGSV